jgi:hypothetical protein
MPTTDTPTITPEPLDYDRLARMLDMAQRNLAEAKILEAKGGPIRTRKAADLKESARLWALDAGRILTADRDAYLADLTPMTRRAARR